jgi:hypothetical protein
VGTSAEIREAVDGVDVESVRELVREYSEHLASHPAGPEHFCISGMDRELEELTERYAPPGCLLLATAADEPAGCVALKALKEPANALELKRLWVRPGFRGLGLGRRLMESAIEAARKAGVDAIYLDTVPAAMPEATRMYEEFGFRRTEPYHGLRTPGIEFFRLPLTAVVRSSAAQPERGADAEG